MQVSCTQENLSRALSYIERVAGKQTTLPILSNFLLETEKGRLKISATNLEIGVVVTIGAKITKEGKIAIPAKILAHFVNNIPSSDILELEEENKHLKISSTAYQTKIKGMDGKDFPIIPHFSSEYQYILPAQVLKNAFSRILFCVSLNEARLELTGVSFLFSEEKLSIVATDSFRLAEEIVLLSKENIHSMDKDVNIIIPNIVLNELLRVITPESTVVKMALEENQVFFEVDGVEVTSRLINGKYPDYQQIIPKEFNHHVIFEKTLLQRAIKIAGSLASYNAGEIALVFDAQENTCTFLSHSQEVGENKTVLPVEYQKGHGTLTILFNPRYILEGVNTFSTEKIIFCANNSTTPVALRAITEKGDILNDYLYLVMPIRK